MRLILIAAALALTSCGERVPANIRATGEATETTRSAKSPHDMVACMTPLYDAVKWGGTPILMRITATGFELIEMGGMYDSYVLTLISVDGAEGGSTAVGYIASGIPWHGKHRRRLGGIISQCAQPD